MSKLNDFSIKDGVLKKYKGKDNDLVIPEGVTCIGEGAFYGCDSVVNVTISNGVTKLGKNSFRDCKNLLSISLPESLVDMGEWSFVGCEKLSDVTIPHGVTTIGEHMFFYCKKLKRVLIPEGVTSIGDGAFLSCSELEDVNLPSTLVNIGRAAFSRCLKLSMPKIPDRVECIGGQAYMGCKAMADNNGMIIVGNTLYGFEGDSRDVIVKGVSHVGELAFQNKTIKSVTIQEGVSSIEWGAFSGCDKLTKVVLPKSLIKIAKEAFDETGVYDKKSNWVEGGLYISNALIKVLPSQGSSFSVKDDTFLIGDMALNECGKLNAVSSPILISCAAAPKCSFGLLLRGEKYRYFAFSAKENCDNLSDFVNNASWDKYDSELINNGPTYKYSLSARLFGAMGRLLEPVLLTKENRAAYEELLVKNAKKLVSIAEQLRSADLLRDLFSLELLNEKAKKDIKKLVAASTVAEIAELE